MPETTIYRWSEVPGVRHEDAAARGEPHSLTLAGRLLRETGNGSGRMLLVGRYASPYVRRVGVCMTELGTHARRCEALPSFAARQPESG